MNNVNFFSKRRLAGSLAVSVIFVFWAMNFVSRNIDILVTRSLPRIIISYLLNISFFFIIFYLFFTAAILLYKKILKNLKK